MRVEWLEDILAVLDTGSLTGAAEKRFVTQSAFTRRIRQIEESVSAELFDRSKKPVKLLDHVCEQESEMRHIVVRMNALRQSFADPATPSSLQVSIACQHTIATTISPKLIRDLTKNGRLNVKVRASNRDNCLMMLLSSEVDFAVIFETPEEALHTEKRNYLYESLGSDWMVPVIAADYESEFLTALDKRNIPMVTYPKEIFLGQLFDTHFLTNMEADYQIIRTAETGLALAALHYTLEGIGVGWLPQSIAANDLTSGRLLDISDRLPKQELHVKIVRLQMAISDLAEEVWMQVANEYQTLSS